MKLVRGLEIYDIAFGKSAPDCDEQQTLVMCCILFVLFTKKVPGRYICIVYAHMKERVASSEAVKRILYLMSEVLQEYYLYALVLLAFLNLYLLVPFCIF